MKDEVWVGGQLMHFERSFSNHKPNFILRFITIIIIIKVYIKLCLQSYDRYIIVVLDLIGSYGV